jgi:hypothetical protein
MEMAKNKNNIIIIKIFTSGFAFVIEHDISE